MIIQIVRFKSKLSEDELSKRAEKRKSEFLKIPDLIQKYYVKDIQTGEFGGIYLWKSKEGMMKFKESELAKSIPNTYEMNEPPKVEIFEVSAPLRD